MMFSKDNLPMCVTPLLVALVLMVGSTIVAYLSTFSKDSPAYPAVKRAKFVTIAMMVLSGGWGLMVILPMLLLVATTPSP
jgi:hypothetical protein